MNNEEFLEKLIRLAWSSGYEVEDISYSELSNCLELDSDDCSFFVEIEVKDSEIFILTKWHEDRGMGVFEDCALPFYEANIERIIFDHEFIRVLCDLQNKERGSQFGLDMNLVIRELAEVPNRVGYLKSAFGELVK